MDKQRLSDIIITLLNNMN